MEQLDKFDKELKRLNDYNLLMTKICINMLAVFGYMMLLIPDLDTPLYFFTFEMLILSLSLYLKQFLFVNIDKKPVSIFQILKNTPISKEVYRKDRYNKLKCHISKMSGWCIGLKSLSLILSKETNPKTIFMSFLWLAVMFIFFVIFGAIDIERSTRI